MQINSYLIFNGTCEEAFKFYSEILHGKIEAMLPHEGTPAEGHVPAEMRKKIMHARLSTDGQVLMGSDALPGHYQTPQGFHVSLNVTNAADAERIFAALTKGGTVGMPLQKTFWAERFGMGADRFGIPWMVNCQADK